MTTAGHFRLAMAALAIPSTWAFADGTGAGDGNPASTPDERFIGVTLRC
jgi:hypothetical protein